MIDGKSVLAVIPARRGSKGLPGKNMRQFIDKPLIGWTVSAAQESNFIDRIVLSSNDDDVIKYVESLGIEVPFKRAEDLSTDVTAGVDVVIDAVLRCPGFDYVLLLQPTSPLRTASNIDEALRFTVSMNSLSCISIVATEDNPHWMYLRDKNTNKLQRLLDTSPISRRQDLPVAYVPNGAIYIAEVSWLLEHQSLITGETLGFEMSRSESIDIDDLRDFKLAEFYFGEDF